MWANNVTISGTETITRSSVQSTGASRSTRISVYVCCLETLCRKASAHENLEFPLQLGVTFLLPSTASQRIGILYLWCGRHLKISGFPMAPVFVIWVNTVASLFNQGWLKVAVYLNQYREISRNKFALCLLFGTFKARPILGFERYKLAEKEAIYFSYLFQWMFFKLPGLDIAELFKHHSGKNVRSTAGIECQLYGKAYPKLTFIHGKIVIQTDSRKLSGFPHHCRPRENGKEWKRKRMKWKGNAFVHF